MGLTNLHLCSFQFACHLKDPFQPRRIKNLDGPSLRSRNDCKLLEQTPQRINLYVSDFSLAQDGKGSQVGTRKWIDEVTGSGTINNACREQRNKVIDSLTYCTREGKLGVGKMFHASLIKGGICGDKLVDTALINMYAKCSKIDSSIMVFEGMLSIDAASCNCLISGFLSNGMFEEALSLFTEMEDWGTRPNHYTYSILISGCSSILAVEEGAQLHAHVVKLCYVLNGVVANSLLTMYCKFGSMEDAKKLFPRLPEKNVVSCTAFISGLNQQNAFGEALQQLYLMREHGLEPNEHTLTLALSCCRGMGQCDNGFSLHAHLIKKGMVSGVFVGTAIVDMYTEVGQMDNAEKQLQEMGKNASVVSWNALIAGFVKNERFTAALEAFQEMVVGHMECDEYTLSSSLKACSSLPSLSATKQLHCWVIKANFGNNLHVASSLIEAYTSCGDLDKAEKVFHQIMMPDIVSWNSMIKGYSQHGYFRKAVSLFERMIEEGVMPGSSTFLAVLAACSHCGLVKEGKEFFASMSMDYNIMPEETHYSCMVDLFSRTGQLEGALDFIKGLPIQPTASIWRPFLAGCKYHNNLQLGEFAANRILELEPHDASVYVTMSNMYSQVGRVADAIKQRELMVLKEVKKEPGYSWLEVKGKIHKFFSGDRTHPQTTEMYDLWDGLNM